MFTKSKLRIRPMGARVLLRRLEAEEQSAGGIVIPDIAKEKPKEAEVLAVGPGGRSKEGKTMPISLKKGDRVLVSSFGGSDLKYQGQKLVIMDESDVLAVLA